MNIRRQHHVVELLREHGCREERDRPQRLLAGIGEVMPDRGGNDKHAAGADRVLGTVFQAQLARSREDVRRLAVAMETPAGPRIRSRKQTLRPVAPSAVERKRAMRTDGSSTPPTFAPKSPF